MADHLGAGCKQKQNQPTGAGAAPLAPTGEVTREAPGRGQVLALSSTLRRPYAAPQPGFGTQELRSPPCCLHSSATPPPTCPGAEHLPGVPALPSLCPEPHFHVPVWLSA